MIYIIWSDYDPQQLVLCLVRLFNDAIGHSNSASEHTE